MNDDKLEARLREVLIQLAEAHAFNMFSEVKKPNPTREAIGRIRQVFKDAGYIKPEPSQAVMVPQKLSPLTYMTNGEYLTRFQQELDADKHLMTPGAYKHALEIAKRTANL